MDFGVSTGVGRALPGTDNLFEVEKVRSGVNVMPVIRDGSGNKRCRDRWSGLIGEPEAARQESPRHGVLALMPPESYYTFDFED